MERKRSLPLASGALVPDHTLPVDEVIEPLLGDIA
jgi:hypothetical protein